MICHPIGRRIEAFNLTDIANVIALKLFKFWILQVASSFGLEVTQLKGCALDHIFINFFIAWSIIDYRQVIDRSELNIFKLSEISDIE